jgi:hypothetical protein
MAVMNLRQDTRRRAEAGYSLLMISGHRTVGAVGIQHFRHAKLACSLVPQSILLKSVRLLAQYW